MKDQHCKDISELLGPEEKSRTDKELGRSFRSHRGLTGLYSAVKGTIKAVMKIENIHWKHLKYIGNIFRR